MLSTTIKGRTDFKVDSTSTDNINLLTNKLKGVATWEIKDDNVYVKMSSPDIKEFDCQVTIPRAIYNKIMSSDTDLYENEHSFTVSGKVSSNSESELITNLFGKSTLRVDDKINLSVWIETSFPIMESMIH